MLRVFNADFHIHTCLSPCGDLEMSPRRIVHEAVRKKLDAIAICDHNSARNIPAVLKAAESAHVVVFPGMEICSREEVHVLAIFANPESAFRVQGTVYDNLQGSNDPDAFGMQVIANEHDEVEAMEEKLLIGATNMSIDRIVDCIHQEGGIAIASHIDREAFSVISQLGFVPESLDFDGLELSPQLMDKEVGAKFNMYRNRTFVRNSDAHVLRDIGLNTSRYALAEPSFDEFVMAFHNSQGREVRLA